MTVIKRIRAKTADVDYEVTLGDDGKVRCSCPPFQFSKGFRSCPHIQEMVKSGELELVNNNPGVPKGATTSKTADDVRRKAELDRRQKEEEERAEAAKEFVPRLSYKIRKTDRSIIWPEVDTSFHVGNRDEAFLEVVHQMSKNTPQNVLLTGMQGCGKTELAVWFAARHERPMIVMNCSTIREAKDWFGYKEAKGGTVSWHLSDFVKAIQTPDCVIILDEFNRLHSSIHNSLYPLLDARRQTWVEEIGEMVNVAPGVVFFATCNIGHSHTGTFTLDAALEDRFGQRVECNFLPVGVEIKVLMEKTGISENDARRLVEFASDIRAKVKGDSKKSSGGGGTLTRAVSTRQLLQTAVLGRRFKAEGKPYHDALWYTVLPYYPEDERGQVQLLMQGKFGG